MINDFRLILLLSTLYSYTLTAENPFNFSTAAAGGKKTNYIFMVGGSSEDTPNQKPVIDLQNQQNNRCSWEVRRWFVNYDTNGWKWRRNKRISACVPNLIGYTPKSLCTMRLDALVTTARHHHRPITPTRRKSAIVCVWHERSLLYII